MPMIDLTLPEGALTEAATAALVEDLSAALIEGEGAQDNEYVRSITWAFVDERPARAVNVGGRPAAKPVYRVVLTVPEGAPAVHGPLMRANRDQLVRRVTELVLQAEGTPFSAAEAHRVWVQMREIRDEHWGGFGELVNMHDIATFAGHPPGQPTERGQRMRRAFETSQNRTAATKPVPG
jgi:phenylpyruvate tautomerase PptA (4-oxalocrotonate tautomerase family)